MITARKVSQVLMLFKLFPYQLPNKEHLITIFKICQFFTTPVTF